MCVGGIRAPGREADDLVAELIAALDMPGRLPQVGVHRKDFPLVAKNAMRDRWVHSNARKLPGPEDVITILGGAA